MELVIWLADTHLILTLIAVALFEKKDEPRIATNIPVGYICPGL